MIGPRWKVPVEMIRASAMPAGLVELTRAEAQFAKFEPHAEVEVCPAGFMATVSFEVPKYSGRTQQISFLVWGVPNENRSGK